MKKALVCRDWASAYVDHEEQNDWVELSIEGELPSDLHGTYLRNGPARFQTGNVSVAHPFDGDGAICCTKFSNGRAYFRSKFVQTAGYVTSGFI